MGRKLDQVDYNSLDDAKIAFIEASRRTLGFAKNYGFVPDKRLGSSANIFTLNLKPFIKFNPSLYTTLITEGLGTADDARPDDLTSAEEEKFWYNIAFKTLGALTNDVASAGVQPILISLYLPSSSPEIVFNKSFRKGFLSGIVDGCRKIGCVYISGETPQLKSKIFKGKLDIAGAVFGVVPSGRKPTAGSVKAGDKIVFVESSGPHENGFTPIRELAGRIKKGFRTKLPGGRDFWEGANEPSVLYSPLVQSILSVGITPTNIEPITGHGWLKLMRSNKPIRYVIEKILPIPNIFKFIEKENGSTTEEMIKIFNYGVGLVVFIKDDKDAVKVVEVAKGHKLKSIVAGYTERSTKREVYVKPLGILLTGKEFVLRK
ncbi:MAG: AIR synthase related protein [Candidatus Woykebacteria bacterium]